ncbi:MAG: hypothetical protein OXC40_02895, partial [Proteobacteria bacterium]|nr:hypothetical protein [Pseudomonadota bacterium]
MKASIVWVPPSISPLEYYQSHILGLAQRSQWSLGRSLLILPGVFSDRLFSLRRLRLNLAESIAAKYGGGFQPESVDLQS